MHRSPTRHTALHTKPRTKDPTGVVVPVSTNAEKVFGLCSVMIWFELRLHRGGIPVVLDGERCRDQMWFASVPCYALGARSGVRVGAPDPSRTPFLCFATARAAELTVPAKCQEQIPPCPAAPGGGAKFPSYGVPAKGTQLSCRPRLPGLRPAGCPGLDRRDRRRGLAGCRAPVVQVHVWSLCLPGHAEGRTGFRVPLSGPGGRTRSLQPSEMGERHCCRGIRFSNSRPLASCPHE